MKNILVLTSWSFKEGLIQSYTLPYLKMIAENLVGEEKIDLITFEKPDLSLSAEEAEQAKQELWKNRINWLPKQYSRPSPSGIFKFPGFLKSFTDLIKNNNIQTIHSFCPPISTLGYILSMLTGKRLVLDSFEPHAEALVENGTWKNNGLRHRVLSFFEKRMVRKADYIIATATGMIDYAKSRYNFQIDLQRFFVKPACVDLNKFQPLKIDEKIAFRNKLGIKSTVVAVYAGKLGGIYHDQEVFELIKSAHEFWKGDFTFLMLTNDDRSIIDSFCESVDLDKNVVKSQFVNFAEIQNYIGLADFGITPVKSVPSKRLCTPIKDGEYWALGLPVIITPNISDDSKIIEENNIGAIVDIEDKDSYQESFRKIDNLLKQDLSKTQENIRQIAERYRSFEIAKKVYQTIYTHE